MAYADVLVAKAGGHFDKQGLSVTIFGGRGSSMAVQQILSGQAMFSRTGGVDLMKAVANEGAPLLSVAVITQGSPFYVVSRKDRPIKSPKDMAGKTIGIVSKGGATENLLDIMLAASGLDPKRVPREVVGNAPGAFGLIEQGRIHAYIISVGSWVALRRSGALIESFNTDDVAPIPGQVYVTSREAASREPDTVVRFLKAIDAAMIQILADRDLERTVPLLKAFEIAELKDVEAAKEGLRSESAMWTTAGTQNRLRHVPAHWQQGRDLMAKAGVVKPGPADIFYTNEFIDRARA